jgi:hypothetical protein
MHTEGTSEIVLDLALTEKAPPKGTRTCVVMIVGNLREPYLAAALASQAKLFDWAVINLNGQEGHPEFTKNLDDVLASQFNQEDRLTILGLPFRNFSFNQNLCLEATRDVDWVVATSADEVWYDSLSGFSVADVLAKAEGEELSRITGYFWHFLRGHTQVHNRDAQDPLYLYQHGLLRQHSELYWHYNTHEQATGYRTRDLVLQTAPLFAHFSYIDPELVFRKWQHYAALEGQSARYGLGYFNDRLAPWRKAPKNILDDRKGYDLVELGGELPAEMQNWWLHPQTLRLHKASCPVVVNAEGECCGHDPLPTPPAASTPPTEPPTEPPS